MYVTVNDERVPSKSEICFGVMLYVNFTVDVGNLFRLKCHEFHNAFKKKIEMSQIKQEIMCFDSSEASETDEIANLNAPEQNEIASCIENIMENLENKSDGKSIKEEREDVHLENLKIEIGEHSLVQSDLCGLCNGKLNNEADFANATDDFLCICQEQRELKPDYVNFEDLVQECGITAVSEIKEESISEGEVTSEETSLAVRLSEITCKICEKVFKNKWNLKVHMEKHSKEKPFYCEFCSKYYKYKKTVEAHRKFHAGEATVTCEICKKVVMNRHLLRAHMISHRSELSFQCEICSKYFKHKKSLKLHLQYMHKEEKTSSENSLTALEMKELFCEICSKYFRNKCHLKEHMRVHTGEKPFNCKFCPKSFSHKCALIKHERIHTGEKPFSCSDCSRTFNQSWHLRQHEKRHNKEQKKLFSCEICSKSFSEKSYLRGHKEVHRTDKKFCCEICSKSFKYNRGLLYHLKTHNEEKLFRCDVCSKSFKHNEGLKGHQKIHTNERFQCEICQKFFKFKSSIKVHHRRFHLSEKKN